LVIAKEQLKNGDSRRGRCDEWQEESPDQMRVDIASLVL
jgi:hypothetical protein